MKKANDNIERISNENCVCPAMGIIAAVEEQSVPTKWSMSMSGKK